MKIRYLLIFLLFFLSTTPAHALFGDAEPLKVEEAFKLKAYAIDPHILRFEWEIAEGHYLYKEKFQFSTNAKGITLGDVEFPKGKIMEDEFFGKVESYRQKIVLDIPISRTEDADQDIVIKTVSQGCADIGLCYPPQKVDAAVSLIPVEMAEPAGFVDLPEKSSSSFFSIKERLGFIGKKEFLPVDQAFAFTVEIIDGNTLLAHWEVAEGYYLYREKFVFSLDEAGGVTLEPAIFPKGKMTHDENFGDMEVYTQEAAIKIPLSRAVTSPTDIVLRAKFQGCADAGFCYPPEERIMSLALPAGQSAPNQFAVAATSDPNAPGMLSLSTAAQPIVSEQDGIAASIAGDNIFWVILSFFGFGLLLSFTPCVFPMIPILSSIIVGQGEAVTTRRAFTMSLVYVLAMALTYTVAGVFAGLFGANLQAVFQNPWILGGFSIVFVLLALSMFGFYELQLPSSWQSKLTDISNKQRGGTLVGVAIMGFLSALIVGPCVAAPLAGALIYIGQTGDAVLGGLALFALSMGMGAPLLAIGTSAGKLLPRAGAWMDAIKAVFGVMLLAVAIWMLERIIPSAVAMLLWALLLIMSGVYLGALSSLDAAASGWKKLWKGLGVVLLIYGVLQLVGVASNSSDPLQPLRALSAGTGNAVVTTAVAFDKIKSLEDLEQKISLANQQGKPVFLDFYADWCVSCKEMERYTFSDAGVQTALANGVLLKADVTANDDVDQALMKKLGVIGPPSMLFFNRQGEELSALRLVGHMDAKPFEAHVIRAFQ